MTLQTEAEQAEIFYNQAYDDYYSYDDGEEWLFGFGGDDLSLDTLKDLNIDVSECDGVVDGEEVDEDALKDCLEAIEAGVKGLDISKLAEEAWDGFKEEDDWEEAVEVAKRLDVDLGKLADDLVTDVASTLEAQVEGSALIDAGAWYAVYEDFAAGAFNDLDMSAAGEQAEALAAIPDEF